MISKIYSVFDSKTGAFMQPFQQLSHGQAIRTFTDLVADQQSLISKHPSDFTLYYIADFDDSTATYTSPPAPQSLQTGSEAQLT